jgi:MFS family permease
MLLRMQAVAKRLREAGEAFRAVFANPNLRRLELGWAGSVIGQWAYAVALVVYAFGQGGASAVALTWVVRMIPSALLAPFAGLLADRFPRARVMVASDVVRAALLAAGAACIWTDAPAGVVYALAAAVSVSFTPFRSAEAALTPSLATTPEQLTAAKVASSSLESVGFFAGPALAGVLLAVSSPAVVFVLTAGTFLWSAVFILAIEPQPAPLQDHAKRASVLRESLAGFEAIIGDGRLRLLVGLLTTLTVAVGAFEVLTVSTAIDLLHMGKQGVGYLNSAFGVGALVGALGGVALVGVRRLSGPFLVGVLLWSLPVALIGVWPNKAAALVLLGVVGLGGTLADVAGFTLVQRVVRDEVLARVFGVIQMTWLGSVAIGAVIAPPLLDWLGIRGTLVLIGLIPPALTALVGMRLVRVDAAAEAPVEGLGLLRAIPIFAPLPATTLEHLAGRLVPLRYDAGAEIVRQGDRGDRFYLIAEGEVEVEVDGSPAPPLGPGDSFGEIALLRDVPRTATVRAKTAATVYALERDDFLGAVTGHSPSAKAAEAIAGSRLGRGRPAEAASS